MIGERELRFRWINNWLHEPTSRPEKPGEERSFHPSLFRYRVSRRVRKKTFSGPLPLPSLPLYLRLRHRSFVRSFAPSLFYDEDSGRARGARNGVASSLHPRSSRTNRCFVTRGNFGDSKYLVSLLRPSTSLSLLPGSRHKLQWSTSKLRVTQTKCFKEQGPAG